MKLKAIIFDMDGVIVDTEFVEHHIQEQFVLNENTANKVTMTGVDISKFIGSSHDNFYNMLNHFTGNKYNSEELQRKYQAFRMQKIGNLDYLTLFRQDIIKILHYAKDNRIKLAVASSSPFQQIIKVLTACGILSYFDVIRSGESVPQSKPHPAIYERTVCDLDVLPENCVAIEDSYYGLSAANAAGLTTIAYKEERLKIDQSIADYLAKDMREVLNQIQRLAPTE